MFLEHSLFLYRLCYLYLVKTWKRWHVLEIIIIIIEIIKMSYFHYASCTYNTFLK